MLQMKDKLEEEKPEVLVIGFLAPTFLHRLSDVQIFGFYRDTNCPDFEISFQIGWFMFVGRGCDWFSLHPGDLEFAFLKNTDNQDIRQHTMWEEVI